MDWTGGSRRRFAAGKATAVTQKQKAHFARMRAAKHSAISSQPASSKPSFHYTDASRSHQLERIHPGRVGPGSGKGKAAEGLHAEARRHLQHSRQVAANRSACSPDHIGLSGSAPLEISSDRSTSSFSEDSHDQAQLASENHAPRTVHDEELQLLVKRRRLLARSDWLGLAPARPLRIRFPSLGASDQIGRRKKVKKSRSRRGEPAQRRLITPIFERDLQPGEYLMSGALPATHEDEVDIRIGTDAFASQGARSRRSQTDTNLGARPPTTETGPMSELSMLLGDDGDNFDANKVSIPTDAMQARAQTPEYEGSVYAHAGSQMPPGTYQSREAEHDVQVSYRHPRASAHTSRQPQQRQSTTHGTYYRSRSDSASVDSNGDSKRPMATVARHQVSPIWKPRMVHDQDGGLQDDQEDMKTDALFRQFLGVWKPDHAPRIALDSQSEHATTSEIIARAGPRRSTEWYPVSTCNKQQETAPRALHNEAHLPLGEENETLGPTKAPDGHSTSEPLLVADSLAKQHQPLTESARAQSDVAEVDQEDDAAWRHFILGTQDSDSELSNERFRLRRRESSHLSPPRSPSVSGLGTSQAATQGLSAFGGHAKSLDKTSDNTMGRSDMGELSDAAVQGSEAMPDSIEDLDSSTKPSRRPANIHATATAVLNPRRFKRPAKPPQASTVAILINKKPTRAFNGKRDVGHQHGSAEGHDIYDIVESDVTSVS